MDFGGQHVIRCEYDVRAANSVKELGIIQFQVGLDSLIVEDFQVRGMALKLGYPLR